MIIDRLDNARLYGLGEALEIAAKFVRGLGPDTAEGEYPIRGQEIFARVMRYETRPLAEGRLEAHDRYADVQALITGREECGWAPREGLRVMSHDEANDVLFLEPPREGTSMLTLLPGLFALFMPRDAHMPCLTPRGDIGSIHVLKVVVKIEARLLDYTGRQHV